MSITSFVKHNLSDTCIRIQAGDKEILLLGTAHISQESVDEVRRTIREERPDHLCVEIDEGRLKSLEDGQAWVGVDIKKILRQKRGFMLMANLVLSSYQRRMGINTGIRPGEEMRIAIETAKEEGILWSCSDRPIQMTLMRAWRKSGFWTRMKLLASLLASAFTRETLDVKEIEALKKSDILQTMMKELADYLPSIKQVLIDERDRYLASKIYQTEGKKILAVVGAGHVPGMIERLEALYTGEVDSGVEELEHIPPKRFLGKVLPWIVPLLILGIISAGFWISGAAVGRKMILVWILANGIPSAVGAILALGHPLTVLLSFGAAPITSMNPTIGVGMVAGILEYFFRPPRVGDMENLNQDITGIRGWYRNRISRILLVFFLSSLGSMIGTFYAIPRLSLLLGA